MNTINIPYAEQFDRMNDYLRAIAEKGETDISNSPGSKVLLQGDRNAGFYGFVQPAEMGEIEVATENLQAYSGSNLALALAFSSGTAFNSDVPLMKFAWQGNTVFIPLTGYRYSASWDSIYNAGLVFGTSDEGFLPPTGRVGDDLSIDSTDNSINCINGHFLGDKTSVTDYADIVGVVGDSLQLKGWSTEGNNTTVEITSITDKKIIVSGATFTSESGSNAKRFYNVASKVTQNKSVKIGSKDYKVMLMTGGSGDVVDYLSASRGTTGVDNMWNSLILPLHEHAKISNWTYPDYAKNAAGEAIADWQIGLTDKNLKTDYHDGSGSYTWTQNIIDKTSADVLAPWFRLIRGVRGASYADCGYSWYATSSFCWRPVLVAV